MVMVAPSAAHAQVVSGDVVDEDGARPVTGAFVQLFDSAGTRVTAVLTRGDGSFIITVHAQGQYRLQIEHIGRATVTWGPFRAGDAAVAVPRIVLRAQPVTLAALEASDDGRCSVSRGAALATQRLWDETRKALEVTAWLERDAALPWQVHAFTRLRDVVTDRLVDAEVNERRVRSGVGPRPFVSASPDSLALHGYVQRAGVDYRYYGLDAHALLSDAFLATHCLRVVRSTRRDGDVGLGFEPLPGQAVPDVRGVVWLDPSTLELRRVEFSFTRHLHFGDLPGAAFGGSAEFRRLPDGAWVVSRWRLRMPQRVEAPAAPPPSVYGGDRPPADDRGRRLAARQAGLAVLEEGGDIALVALLRPDSGGAIVEGTVFDSTRAIPLAGATVFLTTAARRATTDAAGRFRLTGVPPGPHEVAFFHARTDALALTVRPRPIVVDGAMAAIELAIPAMSLCPADAGLADEDEEDPRTAVLGFAVDERTGDPAAGVTVTASWEVQGRRTVWDALRGISGRRPFGITATADADGRFVLCGVPAGIGIRLRAGGGPVRTVLTGAGEFARRDVIAR